MWGLKDMAVTRIRFFENFCNDLALSDWFDYVQRNKSQSYELFVPQMLCFLPA
jgi:hypothetical protein